MIHIFYHANCADGLVAAVVALKRLKLDGLKATAVPLTYGKVTPEMFEGVTTSFFVDFCPPKEILEMLNKRGEADQNEVHIVLDHHKTAKETCEAFAKISPECDWNSTEVGKPSVFCRFDMEKSGARLAWNYFFPGEGKMPDLVKFVEDRDIWRWAFGETEAYTAGLFSRDMTLENYQALLDESMGPMQTLMTQNLVAEGGAILRAQGQHITRILREVRNNQGFSMVNSPIFQSEIGDKLCKDGAPFAVIWHEEASGTYKFSLRSRSDFDVTQIAKLWPGGGGHAQAAGFTTEDSPRIVTEEIRQFLTK